MIDEDLLAQTVHDTGIRRLQHAYADVVNRRAWPELEELFRPDAEVVIDGAVTSAYGLYHDRYVLEGGRWWFAERRYHSLARHGGVLDVFPLPDSPGIDVPGAGA